jgi:hypothetical protein
VCAELAKEHVDLDAVADQEHANELLKGKVGPHGGDHRASTNLVLGLSKGGTDRQAAQLAARRPDLAQAVRDGRLKLSAALIEAGIRKISRPEHCDESTASVQSMIASLQLVGNGESS